jgi:hypothetical protein
MFAPPIDSLQQLNQPPLRYFTLIQLQKFMEVRDFVLLLLTLLQKESNFFRNEHVFPLFFNCFLALWILLVLILFFGRNYHIIFLLIRPQHVIQPLIFSLKSLIFVLQVDHFVDKV